MCIRDRVSTQSTWDFFYLSMTEKESLAIILIMIASCVAGGMKCTNYTCASMEIDQCAVMKEEEGLTTYTINACNNSKVCDIQPSDLPIKCTDYYNYPFRYPGENCRHNAECKRGTCSVNMTCTGGSKGDTCTDDLDCGPRLYCDSETQTCARALTKDADCTNGKCDTPYVCNNKKCTSIGSLQIGDIATSPAACKSFYIKDSLCHEGPKLVRNESDPKSGPIECTEKCTYKLADVPYDEPCLCGKTDQMKGYCSPGRAEIDNLNHYISYASKDNVNDTGCHISKGPLCLPRKIEDMGMDFYKAYYAYNLMTRWITYYNNPQCLKKSLNFDHWYAKDKIDGEENSSTGNVVLYVLIGIGAFILIAVIGIVIFLCRRKGEDDIEKEIEQKTTFKPFDQITLLVMTF
eukprot:TRINITY_DN3487_c0_g1_i1.p1 TRINITY_DN3487_c0_g1~~TRINITY_DN3487_c0_g1_i1.p1  ORF type:complete len:405 (+),score=64.23 TRINITY_DN3487_c0_g1_i1:67-1281(+)